MTTVSGYSSTFQVDITKLTISKPDFPDQLVDIRDISEELIIYEDLFQQSISAKLIIRDQLNLVGVLPIVGGETISVKYRTPIYDQFIDLKFIVYKVGEREISEDSSNINVCTLFLCTPETWWSVNNDISMGLKGTYTEIIDKLLNLYPGKKKSFDKEDTIGINTYVVPYLNIFRAIRFCASRSLSESYAPYFFWETCQGYNLKNLKSLYDQASVKRLFIGDRNVFGQELDPVKLFNTCYSYEYLESNDRLHQNINMDFGGKFFVFDMTSKNIELKTYDYGESFDKNGIHLEGFKLNDDSKTYRNKSGFINTNPDRSDLSEWMNRSSIDLIGNVRLMVAVPGDSNLKTGDNIWINIPSKIGNITENEHHTSGKYIITSIKHLIQKESYTQVLELAKDSFAVKVRQNEGGTLNG